MRRTGGLIAVVGILAIALAGCAPDQAPGSDGATNSAEPTPTSTARPSVTPSSAPGDIPLSLSCTTVLTDQVVYDWGSGNWAADPDFAVAPGSTAATIVEHGGTACGWVNLTSGEKLTVAVGEFAPTRLAALREERAARATAVSDFGATGYFTANDGIGQADAFSDPYWITASSSWFGAPADAEVLVATALEAAAS